MYDYCLPCVSEETETWRKRPINCMTGPTSRHRWRCDVDACIPSSVGVWPSLHSTSELSLHPCSHPTEPPANHAMPHSTPLCVTQGNKWYFQLDVVREGQKKKWMRHFLNALPGPGTLVHPLLQWKLPEGGNRACLVQLDPSAQHSGQYLNRHSSMCWIDGYSTGGRSNPVA